MTSLYVANGSKQIFDFLWREPEKGGVFRLPIPIGGQIKIADRDSQTIDLIVEHARRYGALSTDEVRKAGGDFVGICYSIDKPIAPAKIHDALEKHVDILMDRGEQVREEVALAASDKLQKDLIDAQINPDALKRFDMQIIEEKTKPAEDGDMISETLSVSRNAPETRRQRRTPAGKSRANA